MMATHGTPAFPSKRCSAIAKRYGRPCRKLAVQGSTVCAIHGAYAGRHGRVEAEMAHAASKLIAEYLRQPGRHLADVLADAMHTTDAVQRAMRDRVARGDATAEEISQMTDAARQAAAIGVAIHRQGLLERIVTAQEIHVARTIGLWERVLDRAELSREQRLSIEAAFDAELDQYEASVVQGEVIANGARR